MSIINTNNNSQLDTDAPGRKRRMLWSGWAGTYMLSYYLLSDGAGAPWTRLQNDGQKFRGVEGFERTVRPSLLIFLHVAPVGAQTDEFDTANWVKNI